MKPSSLFTIKVSISIDGFKCSRAILLFYTSFFEVHDFVIFFFFSFIKSKSNLLYTYLISFRVSQVSGAHFRGFAPGHTIHRIKAM